MIDKLELEQKAMKAYMQIVDDMRSVRSAYEAAGVAVPERVLRFLGNGTTAPAEDEYRIIIPPPSAPPSPPEAGMGWIWVPAAEMTVVGLVKATLRHAGAPVPRDRLLAELQKWHGEINTGTVANIGTRLSNEGVLQRTSDGWLLSDVSQAAVLCEGNAWGTNEFLEPQEIAASRRLCVLHVLRVQPDGLQPMQLLKTLEQCDWLKTPVSKDLIKADLQMLDEQGRAKRVGNSGKWKAT